MNACERHAPKLVDGCQECVAVVDQLAPQARAIQPKQSSQAAPRTGKTKNLEQARQDLLGMTRKQMADEAGIPEWFTTRRFRRAMKQASRKRGKGWTKPVRAKG